MICLYFLTHTRFCKTKTTGLVWMLLEAYMKMKLTFRNWLRKLIYLNDSYVAAVPLERSATAVDVLHCFMLSSIWLDSLCTFVSSFNLPLVFHLPVARWVYLSSLWQNPICARLWAKVGYPLWQFFQSNVNLSKSLILEIQSLILLRQRLDEFGLSNNEILWSEY